MLLLQVFQNYRNEEVARCYYCKFSKSTEMKKWQDATTASFWESGFYLQALATCVKPPGIAILTRKLPECSIQTSLSTLLLKLIDKDGPALRGGIDERGNQVFSLFDLGNLSCEKDRDSTYGKTNFYRLTKDGSKYKKEVDTFCIYLKFRQSTSSMSRATTSPSTPTWSGTAP